MEKSPRRKLSPGPRRAVWPVPDGDVVSLPRTFRDAVRAEFGRALRPPYATLSTVAANGAFMSVAWFFLPRGLKDDTFTLHGFWHSRWFSPDGCTPTCRLPMCWPLTGSG